MKATESFSISPIHTWLFGVVVMMAHLWSVGCEFKLHKGLFNLEVFCHQISGIRLKLGKTQITIHLNSLVKSRKHSLPISCQTWLHGYCTNIPIKVLIRKRIVLWEINMGTYRYANICWINSVSCGFLAELMVTDTLSLNNVWHKGKVIT